MRVGDLVRLILDDSIGIIFRMEAVAPRGVYEERIRYWVAWQGGQAEWSWEEELKVISEYRRFSKINRHAQCTL